MAPSNATAALILLVLFFVDVFVVTTAAKSSDWWQSTVIYQIYPRSFKDSNGDGIGDLNGLLQKLPYLHGLGVGTLCLSSVLRSPMADFGYDVSDFRAVDPVFGSMDDFEQLIKKAKELNLKVLLDFVPNHSSDQHEWFRQSSKQVAPFTDYYVWRNGTPSPSNSSHMDPPNNWLSRFGGSAWEWSPERRQFYLHTFSRQQPDLNYRNPKVIQEMKDILKYWLEKGVNGFRMTAVMHLFENPSFLNEPLSNDHHFEPTDYESLRHIYTTNLNDTYDMVRQWRQLLDKYKQDTDRVTRLLVVEVNTDTEHTMAYYGNVTHPGAHFPLNPVFLQELNNQSKAMDFSQAIRRWEDYMHDGRWANWLLGSQDVSRAASRLGPQRVDSLHMLGLLLPGTAFTYYGEELGMTNTYLTWEQTVDPHARMAGKERYYQVSRDPVRTPFQWDSSTSAGFSSNGSPWLPVNPDYRQVNLHTQQHDKRSHYSVYRRLVAARQESTMLKGQLSVQVISDSILTFSRAAHDKDTFVVVINVGDGTEVVNLKSYNLPKVVLVHTASGNSKYRQSDRVYTKKLELQPYAAVVLTTGKVRDYVYNRSVPSAHLVSAIVLLGSIAFSLSRAVRV